MSFVLCARLGCHGSRCAATLVHCVPLSSSMRQYHAALTSDQPHFQSATHLIALTSNSHFPNRLVSCHTYRPPAPLTPHARAALLYCAPVLGLGANTPDKSTSKAKASKKTAKPSKKAAKPSKKGGAAASKTGAATKSASLACGEL